MIDVSEYGRMMSQVAFPILVGNATLLAMVSLRNQHVSDRARANVLEALYQLPTSKLTEDDRLLRLRDLRTQNKKFLRRYQITSAAFVILSITLTLVAAAALLSSKAVPDGDRVRIGGMLAALATGLGLLGVIVLLAEFFRGFSTLQLNDEILQPKKSKS